MIPAAIPFPDIGPNLFALELGGMTFALRYYALAYICGILMGWWMGVKLATSDSLWQALPKPLDREQADEFITWIIIGIIAGGRLGFVLFYQPAYYLSHPLEILFIWQGGMAFHGGFLGVVIAVFFFTRKHRVPLMSMADVVAICVPPGLFFGRVANFINNELWGRPTDLPWGVVFPGERAQKCGEEVLTLCARHPSQLYEAALEGIVLLAVLLYLALRRSWFDTPAALTGVFLVGYGAARFVVEFVRVADAQFITPTNPLGYVVQLGPAGLSMGQLLSLPMIIVGAGLIIWARGRAAQAPS